MVGKFHVGGVNVPCPSNKLWYFPHQEHVLSCVLSSSIKQRRKKVARTKNAKGQSSLSVSIQRLVSFILYYSK